MGDQKFICGRHKGRTFEDVAKNDADFCEAVLRTTACNKYYPEEFKLYLLSQGHRTLSEDSVRGFTKKWNPAMRAEFRTIIDAPKIEIKPIHMQTSIPPNENLNVFIRYFVKKCIFNVQNANAFSYRINTFASIFPFRVSRMVTATRLPVRDLFDVEFYSTIAAYMTRHFEDKSDSAHVILDLFLRNVYDFKRKHFNESAMHRLKRMVDSTENPKKSTFVPDYVVDYLKQFSRLNKTGVTYYTQLRQIYNALCAAFGRADLGDQPHKQVQKLPEINIYQLFQLLEPDFYTGDRARYINWFEKYLFFFVFALDSTNDADNHPIFFIDDPLYECLKYYAEYRRSREPAKNLKLCLWMMTLVHRRPQSSNFKKLGLNFDVDGENLQHVRVYIENFPGIKSAKVCYGLPTSLMFLGIPIMTEDTMLTVCYRKTQMSRFYNFHKGIIRALMCPFNVKRVVIYNSYDGVETSLMVPPVKKEVLEFIRRNNKYDPAHPKPVEYIFTKGIEFFFEKSTIQWDDKFPRKSNSVPVLDYKEFFDDA